MLGDDRDRLADELFDIVQILAFGGIAEGIGDAGCAGPGGAPDAMDITFRDIGYVES